MLSRAERSGLSRYAQATGSPESSQASQESRVGSWFVAVSVSTISSVLQSGSPIAARSLARVIARISGTSFNVGCRMEKLTSHPPRRFSYDLRCPVADARGGRVEEVDQFYPFSGRQRPVGVPGDP